MQVSYARVLLSIGVSLPWHVSAARWTSKARAQKKARANPGLFLIQCVCDYSRLPKMLSNIMNMLIKFRYRFSAPMMAALPSHSLSIACAWAM